MGEKATTCWTSGHFKPLPIRREYTSPSRQVRRCIFNYANKTANQRTAITNVDSSRWVYQYDALGQVVSGKKYWSDGTPVAGQQFEYGFDDIGNRKTAAVGGDNVGANLRYTSYAANNLNQYTSRDVPGFVNVIGSASNTATVTLWGDNGAFSATVRKGDYFRGELGVTNTANPVWLAITNLAVLNNGSNPDLVTNTIGKTFVAKTPEAFYYDLDGNLTNDGRWVYTWDAENRLVQQQSLSSAPTASKLKLEFAYDSKGRRIQKLVSTNNGSIYVPQYTNRFVYDGWNLVGVLSPSSQLLSAYVWGLDLSGSEQGAGGVGGLLIFRDQSTLSSQPSTNFVAYDGNGNVATFVNATNGGVTAQYEYGPFGEVLRTTGASAKANPFRFSTKYQDDESDYLYYGYRSYNPSTGRWVSRDPIRERGGLNLYGFVGNDSMGAVDLFGLQENLINGPAAALFSWVSRFNPSSIDLSQFRDPYIKLTGTEPPASFETRIWAGLITLSQRANPDPGNSFDGQTKEQWGWLQLSVSVACDCHGKITKVEHPHLTDNGYIRTYGKTYAASEGNSTVSIEHGGVGFESVFVNAFHRNTVGGDARKAWDYLWPEIADRPPWGWRRVQYSLSCSGVYVIAYSGSDFPSHKAYLNGNAIATHMQTGYGAFVFAGGLGQGRLIAISGGRTQ